jgi:ankyrin repeat protein
MVEQVLALVSRRFTSEDYFNFVNAADNNGCTPLFMAAKVKNVPSCSVLLRHGADFDIS